MKKFNEQTKLAVVKSIVRGELLLDEAMRKYEVKSRQSIIRWLKDYQRRIIVREQ